MENQILEILKKLDSRFDNLEAKFDKLETRMDNLEAKFDKLEIRMDNLETNQKEMQKDIKDIKQKNNSIYDQTANLTEFRTEVNMKLDTLKDIENVTKENCFDIARLKSVK